MPLLLLLVVNILPSVLFSRLPSPIPRVRLDLRLFATFLFFFYDEVNDCENNNGSERGIIFIELINFFLITNRCNYFHQLTWPNQ